MKYSICVLAFACLATACSHEKHRSANQKALRKRLLNKRQVQPVLDENESILVNSIDTTRLDTWSYYYTHGAHLAGTNESLAQWTADRWTENGVPASLTPYYTYLNYPVSKSLTLTYPNGDVYTPSLAEDVLAEDSTTSYPNRIPTFHGYSFTGDAEGELVYVGRGQQVDFQRLIDLGVDLEGKIALARYGGPFRGLKVKNAQQNGMAGILIYTDIADDGNITESKGYAAYPKGIARNPSSVQRGSVQFLSQYPGDPTTPGYASKEDSPRAGTESVTPRIPSIPLSWKDALPLLQLLDGNGPTGQEINRTAWIGAANTSYSAGPAPGATIKLSNVMRDATTPIWDTIGIINGSSADEVLVVGNHRDAWIVGGAADPNSGSAVFVELSKALGALLQTGWQPRRTIILASWDAEEYGLLGSTEWVEDYAPWLVSANFAYINLDVAVSGSIPGIAASPDFHDVAIGTMKKVLFPYKGLSNVTLYDVWYETNDGEVGVLGSGSDYTAFLHGNGISAIDLGSDQGPEDPIYHYHSNYDSYYWMSTYGDPGYKYHKAIGQYITLLTYHLANDEIIPLNPVTYGTEMTSYLADLEDAVSEAGANIDLSPIVTAIQAFNTSAASFASLRDQASGNPDTTALVNTKIRDYQRGFASNGGLPRREFFKHVVFAPGLDTGYAPVTWPGVTEAVEAGNFTEAQSEVARAAAAVTRAAEILRP